MIFKYLLIVPLLLTLQSVKSYSAGDFSFEIADPNKSFITLDGGNEKTKVSIGGSYSLSFNRQKPVPAILEINKPGFNMSCSGMSFQGMQFELINTEQLSEAFSQFGSSFGWGILLGVVSSLPTIGDVFSKIQTFSREIQKLLASGCRLGQALGAEIGKSIGKSVGDWGKENFPKTSDALEEYGEWAQGNSGDLTSEIEAGIKGMFGGDDDTKGKMGAEFMTAFSVDSNSLSLSFLLSLYNTTDHKNSAKSMMYSISKDFASGKPSDQFEFTSNSGSSDDQIKLYNPKTFPKKLEGIKNAEVYEHFVTMYLYLFNYFIDSDEVIGHKNFAGMLKQAAGLYEGAVNPQSGTQMTTAGEKDAAKQIQKAFERVEKAIANSHKTLEKGTFKADVASVGLSNGFISFLLYGPLNDLNEFHYAPNFMAYKSEKFEYVHLMAVNSTVKLDENSYWGEKMLSWSNLTMKSKAQVECLFSEKDDESVDIPNKDGIAESIKCDSLPPVILPEARRILRIFQQSTLGEQEKIKSQVKSRSLKYMLLAVRDGLESVVKMIGANNEQISGKLNGATKEKVEAASLLRNGGSPNIKEGIKSINTAISDLTVSIMQNMDERLGADTAFDRYLDSLDKKHAINSRSEIY